MKKSEFKYQPNLAIREFAIPSGGEWVPQSNGWSLLHVRQGAGYCLQPGSNLELVAGSLLMGFMGHLQGGIRASQLGELSLCSFNIIPERLTGLTTLGEQQFLKLPPANESLLKILPPDSPAALKTGALFAGKNRSGLLTRLKLLQIFAEFFLVDEPGQPESTELNGDGSNALKRLQEFLKELPASELLEMNINELAQRTHCTARHLSRIFCKLVGKSFTEKRAELRLEKARELLAASNSKVVQVALDSGYNSLSQFNLMFARRYGISPGKWRRKHGLANKTGSGKTGGQRSSPPESRPAALVEKLSLKPAGNRDGNGSTKLVSSLPRSLALV